MSSIEDIVKRLRESRALQEKKAAYDSMSLNDVIALCQEGDQSAIEYLLKEYRPLLDKIAGKYYLDTQDSEDKSQIADIGFWEAIMQWDPEKNNEAGFVNHVTLIVNRKFTDYLRKDSAEKVKINTQADSMSDKVDDGEGGGIEVGDTIPSKDMSPEDAYMDRESVRDIKDFLENRLSETERNVIRKYIEGYKVSQIAEELEMKYKTVENAIMRVKNKLADHMRSRYQEARSIRDSKVPEFTDEEKQILSSILKKIDSPVVESADEEFDDPGNPYNDFSSEQIDEELDKMENEISELDDFVYHMINVAEEKASLRLRQNRIVSYHPAYEENYYDDEYYDRYKDSYEDLKDRIGNIEYYTNDSQYKKLQELEDQLHHIHTKVEGD